MIYVFLADGCEEIEALTPIDVLRRAKKDVKVVGVGKKTIVSSHNIRITCDAETTEVSPNEDIEAVILPRLFSFHSISFCSLDFMCY